MEFLEHKNASKKWEICPCGTSGVFLDISPIPTNNQEEDEKEYSQSEDNGKEQMEEEELQHINTSILAKYNKYNDEVKDEKYQLISKRRKSMMAKKNDTRRKESFFYA